MPDKTLTRADLSEAIYQEIGLSRSESSQLVETVIDEICTTLSGGESVKISSFGNFLVRQKKERVGRNPKTGVEVPITARQVVVFHASHVLKDKVDVAHK